MHFVKTSNGIYINLAHYSATRGLDPFGTHSVILTSPEGTDQTFTGADAEMIESTLDFLVAAARAERNVDAGIDAIMGGNPSEWSPEAAAFVSKPDPAPLALPEPVLNFVNQKLPGYMAAFADWAEKLTVANGGPPRAPRK